MADEKQIRPENGEPRPAQAGESARRPYRRPVVQSRPLFERMALMCVDEFGDPIPGGPS